MHVLRNPHILNLNWILTNMGLRDKMQINTWLYITGTTLQGKWTLTWGACLQIFI